MTVIAINVLAATPSGFSGATVAVNARVTASCQEIQNGSFPNPLIIDPQLTGDQTFLPSTDELVRCTNGGVLRLRYPAPMDQQLTRPVP